MRVQQKNDYMSKGPSSSEQSVPRPSLISPEGVSLFLQPSASCNKKKLGHGILCHKRSPGDITTQDPYSHPPVHTSAHLPGPLTPCHAPNDPRISLETELERAFRQEGNNNNNSYIEDPLTCRKYDASPLWIPKTVDSTESYIYYVFSYTDIPIIKFN